MEIISGPRARFSKVPVTYRARNLILLSVLRRVGRVLTSDEVHLVSLADNFTVQFSNFFKLPLEWKTKQRNGPGNYRELRETGPWDHLRTHTVLDEKRKDEIKQLGRSSFFQRFQNCTFNCVCVVYGYHTLKN